MSDFIQSDFQVIYLQIECFLISKVVFDDQNEHNSPMNYY
jgi:hypothetical protein